MYELVVSAVNHPDRVNPLWGVFNHRSLRSLSRNGVEVTAAVPRPHAPPLGPYSRFRRIPEMDDTFQYTVSHPRFWYYLPKSALYHRSGDSMAKTIQQWRLTTDVEGDIFHGCHLYPDGYALSEVADRDTVPLTAYAHGTMVNEFESFNSQTQDRLRGVLRDADVLFCSGTAIEAKIRRIEPAASTEVVPIGANPDNFPTDREEAIRDELGVPQGATIVLYCGRYTAKKGVPELSDLIRRTDDESLYFVTIGHGGDLEPTLLEAIEESSGRGTVLSDLHPVTVRRWFAVADLFVLPSLSEGRPTVIYEAMASETPVVATTVGGIPEQVAEDETGWLFEPGDVAQLEALINQATRSDLAEMGETARELLEANGWTWDGHADSIVDTHTTLVERYE